MTKLVTEVKPDNIVPYGKLLVAFFDGFKNKKVDKFGKISVVKIDGKDAESVLYIHIQNSDDKYNVTRKRAGIQTNKIGMRVDQKDLYKLAYTKYLAEKDGSSSVDSEKEALKAKIAELELKAKKVRSTPKAVKIETPEIKEEIQE